jgi:hypothetical protein
MSLDRDVQGDGLAGLFAAYREACPDPEVSPEFMPRLWQKIESRRIFAYSLKRLAQGIITAAAVASLAMGVYLAAPRTTATPPTYLELLAAGPSHDDIADAEIVRPVYENNR